jgi:serine/threonine protein kinase
MGEVYRARDTKLDRDVAIKIIAPSVARDTDRLARFEREAKVLASLSHPKIAQIYGLQEDGGTRALVMELIDGDTLHTPVPPPTAPNYATIRFSLRADARSFSRAIALGCRIYIGRRSAEGRRNYLSLGRPRGVGSLAQRRLRPVRQSARQKVLPAASGETGEPKLIYQSESTVDEPAISPDGK